MAKVIRLTESDLVKLIKKVVTESDNKKVKKTDAKTNPHWKQLSSKLRALGFTSEMKHFKEKQPIFFNIGGYPDLDFYRETLTHKSGVKILYPYFLPDYSGDYYPDFVDTENIPIVNNNCLGGQPDFPQKKYKVQCVDFLYNTISQAIKKPIRKN